MQQVTTIGWLFQTASLVPAAIGFAAAAMGLFFFVRPSRRGSLIAGFLSLMPALLGMFIVYSAAKEFVELGRADVIPKPSEFAEAAGRGIGTGLFSLLGTSIALYVSLLALLRSHKRNSTNSGQTQTQVSPGLSGQAYQARVTRGLNAYEPPGRADNQGSGGGGVRLDEVVGGAGVGFVPGSPTEAMASARRTFGRDGANEHASSADDDDPDIIDVEEVR